MKAVWNNVLVFSVLIITMLYVGWRFPEHYMTWLYGVLFGAVMIKSIKGEEK